MREPIKYLLLIGLMLILLSLACSIDLGNRGAAEDTSPQQTAVVQRITAAVEEFQGPDVEVPQADPEIIAEESVVEQPIEDQEQDQPVVAEPNFVYQGISMTYDPAIISSIRTEEIFQQQGEFPGETFPAHVELTLEGYFVRDHKYSAIIRIYPVDAFRAISPEGGREIDALQQILNTKTGGIQDRLPFFPVWAWPGGQTFAVKVAYFDFQNGTGVRYLTAFRGDLFPLDNQDLLYSYQALTADGRFVVSAVLPITYPNLPADGASQVDDWETFERNWEAYIEGIAQDLDSQENPSFTPDISVLDAMLRTLQVDG